MKIQVRDQTNIADIFFAQSLERLVIWEFICSGGGSSEGPFDSWDCYFYLGSSLDKTLYGLLLREEKSSSVVHSETVVALLSDPDEMNESAVARALLSAYKDAGGHRIDFIYETGKYQLAENVEASLVKDIFPEAPHSWCSYPATVEVSFRLVEGNDVRISDFEEYRRRDFISAAKCFFGTSIDGLFLVYTLKTNGVLPLLKWDVTWPLSRRGKDKPVRRGKVQGTMPWQYNADPTLCELSQQPKWHWLLGGHYLFRYSKATLRVGGRTPEEAIQNWEHCARILRREKKRTLSSSKDI